MSDQTTLALVWKWDNDPDLLALRGTRLGAARLIVEVAAPMRWGHLFLAEADVLRAARAVESDPYYREGVFTDARSRIDHETGSYALIGERVRDAMTMLCHREAGE